MLLFAVGNLIPNLGGFINWILTYPQEYINLLSNGGSEITSMISHESIYINPLNIFVKDCLIIFYIFLVFLEVFIENIIKYNYIYN
jgi:hypothetical protein